MSLYSKQKWFCNACGAEQFSELPKALGSKFKCCSMECCNEMHWRETLSITGTSYKPNKVTNPDDCYRGCFSCDGSSRCPCGPCHKEE